MNQVTKRDIFVFLALVAIGVFSRLVPHAWHFTAMGAVALLAGVLIPNRTLAFATTMVTLLISDAVLGFYNTMFIVYLAFAASTLIGILISNKQTFARVAIAAVIASIVFFLISNFAVWFEGALYPQTTAGLYDAYIMGVPFYRTQIVADLILSVGLFFSFTRVLSWVPGPFLEKVPGTRYP